MNILYLTNKLDYVCGVSRHLHYLVNGISNLYPYIKQYLITGANNFEPGFINNKVKLIKNRNFLFENRSVLKFLKATGFLVNFIRKENINIVHSHNHYAANIAYIASKFKNIKTIQTNHGILAPAGRLKHFKSDYYIANNDHILKYIIDNKITDSKNVRLIRSGIVIPENIPAKNNKILKIITASRLIKEKGIDIFINSVAKLPAEIKKNVKFIIAGEGKNKIEFEKLATELNLKIEFTGIVENLFDYFDKTDIFVNPTVSASEGFPYSLIEAGLKNNIIITSDFYGYDSVIKNGISGYVFSKGNADELSGKLIYVISNYRNLDNIKSNFVNIARELFDIKKIAKQHIDYFFECTGK